MVMRWQVAAALAELFQAVAAADAGDMMLPSLLWMAPALNPGGFSSEALAYAVALDAEYAALGSRSAGSSTAVFGMRQFAEQTDAAFVRGLPTDVRSLLDRLMSTGGARHSWDVVVCHATPDVWHSDGAFGWGQVQPCPAKGTQFSVGRAMYETDRLPTSWVARINMMDEVWVPSHFALSQFVDSGVDPSKVAVVPEPVDTQFFDPSKHKPRYIAGAGDADHVFRFLSVFKWEKRKGWDVLLRAFFTEFDAEDPVVLIIKTQAFHGDSDFQSKVRGFLAGLGTEVKHPLAQYKVLFEDLALHELPGLYAAADAFVLPSRGEGWGRPLVEAMAMGLPVIATNWSGSTEFLSDSYSLPLRTDGLESVGEHGPAGHQWAVPSVTHLRSLMRWVTENRDEAKALGRDARSAMVANYSPQVVVKIHVVPRLRHISSRLRVSHTRKGARRDESGEL